MRLCNKEFIDKDYEGREADLIYEIMQENGQQIYAFILQELQSKVDYTMMFRLVLYIMSTFLRYFLAVEKNVRECGTDPAGISAGRYAVWGVCTQFEILSGGIV